MARRGFTLIELMVVVVLIGIIAMLAVGSMTRARNERLIFDYARRFHGVIHHGQTRAVGRSSPHLVLLDGGQTGRGRAVLFEGADGFNTGTAAPAPDRDNKCSSHNWTWTYSGWAPGLTDGTYLNEPIEGLDLSDTTGTGVNVTEDITATYLVNGVAQPAVAICYSRSGTPYVGYGGSLAAAVTDPITGVVVATPFTGVVEVNVLRHVAGTAVGQGRKVILASGSAPRIRPCDGFTPGCP